MNRLPRARTLEFVDLVQGQPELAIIRIGLDPVPEPVWQRVFDGIAARVLWPGGFTPTVSDQGVDLVVTEDALERGVGLVELLVTRANERYASDVVAQVLTNARESRQSRWSRLPMRDDEGPLPGHDVPAGPVANTMPR
jgi:hypothetical protein